ncbi:MAG TPA: hypothetical protein VMV07_03390 [Streptosporangiaceae bacterium]|nr:hypothetical protein [Streptosporangiaceae bacterium]HVB42704.1 hypothetical protein [Streptosporangiaceae bacterium]
MDPSGVYSILANPKYTGYMVFGRTRNQNGQRRPVPPTSGSGHRSPPTPPSSPGRPGTPPGPSAPSTPPPPTPTTPPPAPGRRRYALRSRVRCCIDNRRMAGATRRDDRDALQTKIADFFDERVFGPGRAALLTAAYPASHHHRGTTHHPQRPASQPAPATDLLNALPQLAGILADAPERLQQQLYNAFDIQCLYSRKHHQVTIRATITTSTPHAVAAIIADHQHLAAQLAAGSHLSHPPIEGVIRTAEAVGS